MRAQLAAVCLLCLAALATAQKPKTKLYINQREAADASASISKMVRPEGLPRVPDSLWPLGAASTPAARLHSLDYAIQGAGRRAYGPPRG